MLRLRGSASPVPAGGFTVAEHPVAMDGPQARGNTEAANYDTDHGHPTVHVGPEVVIMPSGQTGPPPRPHGPARPVRNIGFQLTNRTWKGWAEHPSHDGTHVGIAAGAAMAAGEQHAWQTRRRGNTFRAQPAPADSGRYYGYSGGD